MTLVRGAGCREVCEVEWPVGEGQSYAVRIEHLDQRLEIRFVRQEPRGELLIGWVTASSGRIEREQNKGGRHDHKHAQHEDVAPRRPIRYWLPYDTSDGHFVRETTHGERSYALGESPILSRVDTMDLMEGSFRERQGLHARNSRCLPDKGRVMFYVIYR